MQNCRLLPSKAPEARGEGEGEEDSTMQNCCLPPLNDEATAGRDGGVEDSTMQNCCLLPSKGGLGMEDEEDIIVCWPPALACIRASLAVRSSADASSRICDELLPEVAE